MASEKQIAANRTNAQRSTGPRTDAGKRIAKINAIRHGLTADAFLLSTDDPAQLAELRRAVRDDLQPEGALEEELVETVVVSAWRLRRVARIEAGLLQHFDEARRLPPDV